MTAQVLGVSFDGLTMVQAVDKALTLAAEERCSYVCTPNPEIVWAAQRDAGLRDAIAGADMTLADGVGVVWAARQLGAPLPERVTGCDLMTALLDKSTGPVYLLGGKPGVAERAADEIKARFPAVTVVGTHDGYFDDPSPILAELAALSPRLIFVGMGSPKQELFMARAKKILPRGLMAGVGGSLDVLAGDVPRAPESWRRHNIEWLYRLFHQPSRITRALKLPLFAGAVLIKKAGLRRAPKP